jgi:hypothetical protein
MHLYRLGFAIFALLLGTEAAWAEVLVSDTTDNSDGRISKTLSCTAGNHVVA